MRGLPFLAAFSDLILNPEANETAQAYLRGKIRDIVKDPKTAELLSPHQTYACKRPCIDSGYFETFNRPNVTLADVNADPIVEVTPTGVTTRDSSYAFDSLILATGFDAMTGALSAIDIRGKGGVKLKDAWAEGPRTYLGLSSAGFPNLFMVSGPGSPSVLTNMATSIEQHVNFIADCIGELVRTGRNVIEAEAAAQDAWVERVNAIAASTLYPSCNSWYLGANVPGKPRVFMAHPGFPGYVAKCAEVAAAGYEGFVTA